MTVTIELGGARDKSPVRWRAKNGSQWSEWRQLSRRAEFLEPGVYQVAAGEGQEDPEPDAVYDVQSLRPGYGGAVDGLERRARSKQFSPEETNVIFFFH